MGSFDADDAFDPICLKGKCREIVKPDMIEFIKELRH
ncbi:hypothetical protein SAMN05428949_7097 [Chitinophaga sp. YR627]|nr:hypothetical protein SAMN05428949_7097 [Chitinophaga sp. YR627]